MSSTSAPSPISNSGKRSSQRGILRASALTLGRAGSRVILLASVLAGVVLVLASVAWGILVFQILPRIDAWRVDLEDQATKAIGVPVRIGHIAGHRQGIWPNVTLQRVQLLDGAGRVALSLPEIQARVSLSTLSPRALADGELRLGGLVVVAPELDVRRDTAGQWHVAGLKIDAGGGQHGSRAADWVLSQARIQITQGTIRWTDEFKGVPTLALEHLDLTLSNHTGLGRRLHELTVEATPPREFGQRFKVNAELSQPLWLTAEGVGVKAGPASAPAWWRRLALHATTPSQWETWSGRVSAALPFVDVQRLKRHVSLPVDVNGGRGTVDAELKVADGGVGGLSLHLALRDVNLRLGPQLAPLSFKRVVGQITFTHDSSASMLAYQGLAFTLSDGLAWPASSGRLQWQHAALSPGVQTAAQTLDWRQAKGGEVSADRLDLALLARLADRLPLSTRWRQALSDLAPRGVVEALRGQWAGLLDAPTHYQVSGRVQGLGWAASAQEGRPGMTQATVSVEADESGGRADLDIKQGSIEFPGVFEVPRIDLGSLQAKVAWAITPASVRGAPPGLKVDVTQASFANADASGQLEGSWRTGSGLSPVDGRPVARFPGRLTLSGRLERAEASQVWRYLPLAIPQAPRDYVRLALLSGQGEKVSFDVDGDLEAFPFKNDVGGRFRVKVPLHNVAMDYVPQGLMGSQPEAAQVSWPAMDSLEGMLVFEGQRMLIQGARGRFGGVGSGTFGLHDVEGRIEDLGQADPHLTIKGRGEGPLDDMVRFLTASPIGRWTSNVLGSARSTGTAAMQLSLDIPLDHADDTRLNGVVSMQDRDNASLRMNPSIPVLAALQGTIAFTETDLNVKARARVWGHGVDVDGRRSADGVTRFVAKGNMSAEGLRQAQEIPFLQKLAQRFSGESPVTVTVTMGRRDAHGVRALPEVQVTSTLQGMATTLPPPLNKAAQQAWPLTVTHRQEDAQGHTDAIAVDLGNPQALAAGARAVPWLRVDLRRDTRGETAKVLRGAINLIEAGAGQTQATGLLPLPDKGVSAQAVVPALDLDAWGTVADLFKQDQGGAAAATEAASAENYLPDSVTVKTGALTFQQRTLKDVAGTLAHPSPGVWRVQLDAQQIAGLIEWAPDTSPVVGGGNRVVARLSRLSVPEADAQALEARVTAQMLSPAQEAASPPALDVVVDALEWRGLPLGKLEVEAVNRRVPVSSSGFVPEWRLTRLRMTTPEAQLNANGNWTVMGAQSADSLAGAVATPPRPRSAFVFNLDLQNSGNLLTRLGLPRTIKGGKGKLTGQVNWLGSPMEPDPLTMAGDIHVDISEGQFLKVDPGMAKLLGVLSLQSLPRRLTLDFRDVFQQGFAFDSIDGDVQIGQGRATTRNLRMRGVQAVVLMEGSADLAKETQDLHVYVVPEVNAGGASLAYAAINPVVGLGTFIAQMLLRKQVADAGSQAFRITGAWADPQVEKVAVLPHVASDATAPAASAPAAASAPGPAVSPTVTKPRTPF